MNNDTEKADELLFKTIERLHASIAGMRAGLILHPGTHCPELKRDELYLTLLETIQKDRDALRRVLVASDPNEPPYIISLKALASQTETIIKTLS